MMTYIYRAIIERGEIRDWVVSFPDVPEAVSQAASIADAKLAAQEALGLALLSYPMRGKSPPRRAYGEDMRETVSDSSHHVDIVVEPEVAAKLAVLDAFVASKRTKSEFAVMLGKDEKEIRRILDPMHPTKFATLCDALEALGRRMVIGVTDLSSAA
jgi:antitoxin HicB